MYWISWIEVIFDRLIDKIYQIAVLTDQHRDEQIALKSNEERKLCSKQNCSTTYYIITLHVFIKLTICFSVYLFEDSKLTASICPKSMSWPSRNMNRSLHTYFFFWYPSNVLSPCNFNKIYIIMDTHQNGFKARNLDQKL